MHKEEVPSLRKSLVSRRLRPAAPSLPMPLLHDAVIAHLAAQGIGSSTVRAHVIALGLGGEPPRARATDGEQSGQRILPAVALLPIARARAENGQ